MYSDGWCEQGGYTTTDESTVNLLKTFANTNYSLELCCYYPTSGVGSVSYQNKTTTSFIPNRLDASTGIDWYACGYTLTTFIQYLEMYCN